ncbi:ABC transporter permease [Shewanella fodinae]|uniref:ABC transporter permease n=1 Tax=Shewanella fodinae TaxID=552357 RepID=UPI001679BE3C|nr:ABC transporter permease [Shewanella fodinae]MCL2907388.1 ABC transporter permease [Shewanella fodinae]GGY93908.1 ABC transporter [Shewanella fodinae]
MWQLLRREFHALQRDGWQLALISYVPLLGFLFLWWLFSAALPRQLPIAIVDEDHSSVSRELGRYLDANSVAEPIAYTDIQQAVAAMRSGEVFAVVRLPYALKRDLLTGHKPTIDLRYNGQFLLVGKLLSSQLQLTLADGLKQISRVKQLAAGVNPAQVEVRLTPVAAQSTALFNRNMNYVGFLVPPMLIALWQLVAMLSYANSLNRELREQSLADCYRLGLSRVLLAKFLFYTPLMLLHGVLLLVMMYGYIGLPIAGSLLWLIPAQLIMLIAVWLWVQAMFFVIADSARVISMCTGLFAPAFAFMGVTFPTSNMPLLAQWWRALIPSSHYIETHIAIVNHGLGLTTVLQQSTSYLGFLLLLLPAWYFAWRYGRALQPERQASGALL